MQSPPVRSNLRRGAGAVHLASALVVVPRSPGERHVTEAGRR